MGRRHKTIVRPTGLHYDAMRVAVFAVASVAYVVISRRCLADPRSHGFYRFFGFEFVTALILLNFPHWLHEPLSARQIVSYLFGAASIVLIVEGVRLLRIVGKPRGEPAPGTNFAFENTTELVRTGAYRWIRHPMYGSLLALACCAVLKDVSIASVALTLAVIGFFVQTARVEEAENLARFGAPYAEYMKQTRRFVPFVF